MLVQAASAVHLLMLLFMGVHKQKHFLSYRKLCFLYDIKVSKANIIFYICQFAQGGFDICCSSHRFQRKHVDFLDLLRRIFVYRNQNSP